MAALVSLQTAMAHLREDDPAVEIDVQTKLDDAEGVVIDYLKRPSHGWTEETVPGPVRSSILLALGTLYGVREAGAEESDPISPAVVSLLRRLRDPALA